MNSHVPWLCAVVEMWRPHPRNISCPEGPFITDRGESLLTAKLAQGSTRVPHFNLSGPIKGIFKAGAGERFRTGQAYGKGVEISSHILNNKVQHERRKRARKCCTLITTEAAFRKNDLIIMGASERDCSKAS